MSHPNTERDESSKFPKPSREPRGLLNEYECGCQIRRDASGGHFIHMCATHNAASDAATRMCDRCVAKLKKLRETYRAGARTADTEERNRDQLIFLHKANAMTDAVNEIQVEQEKQK